MQKNTLLCLLLAGYLLATQNACARNAGNTAEKPGPSAAALKQDVKAPPEAAASVVPAKKITYGQMQTWPELAEKLKNDGLDGAAVDALFAGLKQPPSLRPMGIKVRELYSSRFLPKKEKHTATTFETELGIPGPWFKGVVNEKNARACRDYMEEHAAAFANAELESGVPREIAAALLFVETRLGGYLGEHNAFYNLASMSVTRDPFALSAYLDRLPGSYDRLDWIQEKMNVKADWAYSELKALLAYCFANDMDPSVLYGSVYGAIGLCQFMPSNISKRGVDGDRDGKIDLYGTDDAVASLSNYLRRSGWKEGISLQKKIRVLRSYNAMTIYARTILALAETIRRLDDAPADDAAQEEGREAS